MRRLGGGARPPRDILRRRGAGLARPSRLAFTAETLAPRSVCERCCGELLGEIPTLKAWLRVAKMLFANYEELTDHDAWLIEQYHDPSQTEFHPTLESSHRVWAPTPLIPEVDRAYFRLAQDNTIAAWFEANGFDISKPTIPKEFERRLAGNRAAVSKPATSADARADFVRRYFDSTKRPSMKECENEWAKEHGSSARELLRNDYRDEAKRRKINVKRGPQNFAK